MRSLAFRDLRLSRLGDRFGGVVGIAAPIISSLGVSGQVAGFARIWSTVTRAATVTGSITSDATQWYLDDSAMQGADQAGFFIDPSMDLSQLAVTYQVANAGGEDSAFSAPVQVRYPVPAVIGTIPAITGVVGDVISILIRDRFFDGNPNNNSNASLTYAVTSGALPPGLTLVAGEIRGTLSGAVTGQAFTISATNSGGTVSIASSATVTGSSTILFERNFTTGTGIPSDMVISAAGLVGTIDPTLVMAVPAHDNIYATAGALIIDRPAVSGTQYVSKLIDISALATGDAIEARFAAGTIKPTSTGFTIRFRTIFKDSAGTIISNTAQVNLLVAAAGWSLIDDSSYALTKPAGATTLELRFESTNWPVSRIYVFHMSARVPAAVVIPAIQSALVVGSGKVGDVHSIDYTVTPAGTAVTVQWTADGANIPSANATTFTTTNTQDTKVLGYTITPAGGAPFTAQGIAITQYAPEFTTLPTITPATALVGELLTYTAGVGTNSSTHAVELSRDGTVLATGTTGGTYTATVAGTYQIRDTLTNSGGTISRTSSAIVSVSTAGQAVVIYNNSFGTNRIADFTTYPASMAHDANVTYPFEDNGAMVIGAVGENYPSATIEFPIVAGELYEVFSRTKLFGSGTNTVQFSVAFLNSAGTVLYTVSNTSVGDWQLNPPAAPAGSVKARLTFTMRGLIVSTPIPKRIQLCRLQFVNITQSGASPIYTEQAPQFHANDGYVDIANTTVDFTNAFSGTVTELTYLGSQPHTWAGRVLKIAGTTPTVGTETNYVVAKNGLLESHKPCPILVNIKPAQATLALDPAKTVPAYTMEVNRPIPPVDAAYYVTGGAKPYTYSLITKPAWATFETNGVVHGRAPASPAAAANITVRVTDRRGQTVDVTIPVTVIATRSRTPFVTIPPTADLVTAIGSNKGAGRVIQLQAGSYGPGSQWFQFFQGTQNNPMIIRGVGNTTVLTGLNLNQISGIQFENMKFMPATLPADKASYIVNTLKATDCAFYDCTIEGYTQTIDPFELDAVPKRIWLLDTETFVYHGEGWVLQGLRNVVDSCTAFNCYEASGIYQARGCAIYNLRVDSCRDDLMVIAQSQGCVAAESHLHGFKGNYTSGDHRDTLQSYANNPVSPVRIVLYKNFHSCDGVDDVHCVLQDHDKWLDTTGIYYQLPNDCNYQWIMRDCVFMGSARYGSHIERMLECVYTNCVFLTHPDAIAGEECRMTERRASQISYPNCIFESFSGEAYVATVNNWAHLITFPNSVQLGRSGQTAIFPNWANTGATYESPIDAVKHGAAANTARFWINPAGAWHAAHPNVGPAWMRTGT